MALQAQFGISAPQSQLSFAPYRLAEKTRDAAMVYSCPILLTNCDRKTKSGSSKVPAHPLTSPLPVFVFFSSDKTVKKLAAAPPAPPPVAKTAPAAPEPAKPGDTREARRKERQTRTPPRR